MRTKLHWLLFVLLAVILMLSITAVVRADREVRIYKLPKTPKIFPDKDIDIRDRTKIVSRDGLYKRVIADEIDEAKIGLFQEKGCLIKHRLRRSASFECPQEIVPQLKVRESRIFRILDLKADQQIKADQVWAEGINGKGVNVVVLDTGIDSSHIELSDSILGQKDFVDDDDIAEDPHGHGTHVAGIITANGVNEIENNYATGVAPGAGIYMLRVCDSDGYCLEDDMMAAMEYAVSDCDAKIMSISIGGGNFGSHCDTDPLAAMVNWVVDNDFTVAVAAGNDGSGVSSPACASKAIAVGAVDESGVVPYWSNRGSALDIVAPGVDILSTYSCLAAGDCTKTWYAYMSGTSMSVPHIAGVTALLLETEPTAATGAIKKALYDTATPSAGCQKCRWFWRGRCYGLSVVSCTPEQEGAGIVDAYEAYLAIKPVGPECQVNEDCDDSNPCTDDVCVEGKCVYTNDDANTCDDGLFCTIDDRCSAGACVGDPKICDDSNRCTDNTCNEEIDKCEYVNDNTNICGELRDCPTNTCSGDYLLEYPEDGHDYCSAGTCLVYSCEGTEKACPDTDCPEDGCGVDSCAEDEFGAYTPATNTCKVVDNVGTCTNNSCPLACVYSPECEVPSVLCWSGEYNYLKRSRNQFRKFCLCAEGNYGYQSYSYVRGRQTVYQYIDTGNNENWETKSTSTYYPAYRVKCFDGAWYNTSQDYYF